MTETTTITAKPVLDRIRVLTSYRLPDGVQYAEIEYDGSYSDYRAQPQAIELNGVIYGKMSHNSDRYIVSYRSDAQLARKVKS